VYYGPIPDSSGAIFWQCTSIHSINSGTSENLNNGGYETDGAVYEGIVHVEVDAPNICECDDILTYTFINQGALN